MKIICVDNFARDNHSDRLIAENVNDFYAPKIVEFLNQKFGGDHSPDFFKAVPNDHKLCVFDPR